jgi:hypothetical protein
MMGRRSDGLCEMLSEAPTFGNADPELFET